MSSPNPDTRTRILDAAWTLLEADRGTGAGKGVRMSDIARQAGVSRQAVYLHFPTRAELLIATTRHLDAVKNVDGALAASRQARSGDERLDAFIDAWGGHIPEIYGVAKALIAMQDTDAAAAEAWADRMRAVREGCAAAVRALAADGRLASDLTEDAATDLLWALLTVETWAHLTATCGWSQADYIAAMKRMARRILLAGGG